VILGDCAYFHHERYYKIVSAACNKLKPALRISVCKAQCMSGVQEVQNNEKILVKSIPDN